MVLDDLLKITSVGQINIYVNYWYNFQGNLIKKDSNTLINNLETYTLNILKQAKVLEMKIKLIEDSITYETVAALEVLIED